MSDPIPKRTPVPRGLARSGPPLLSYGFRPFFLMAAVFALLDMVLWIGALSGWWTIAGSAGPIAWHAHEMLFGYGAAAMCGFVLTAVPNWTGHLPVSGRPLLGLVALWLAGRLVLLVPAVADTVPAAIVDALFLPALAAVVVREVRKADNSHNLRVAAVLASLAALNIAFHVTVLAGGDMTIVLRATVGIYVLLIGLIGGRIVPSFTRNYLARHGHSRLPAPVGRFDQVALAATLAAAIAWAAAPQSLVTAGLAALAAVIHAIRLGRWRSLPALREPLLAMLHIAYLFVPLGWLAVAAAALGLMSDASALHVLTVGAVGGMTMAVMARATRGHTGRPLSASGVTIAAFACLILAAVLRPAAEGAGAFYLWVLTASALAWIAAFGLFLGEYAPMLLGPTLAPQRRPAAPTA